MLHTEREGRGESLHLIHQQLKPLGSDLATTRWAADKKKSHIISQKPPGNDGLVTQMSVNNLLAMQGTLKSQLLGDTQYLMTSRSVQASGAELLTKA